MGAEIIVSMMAESVPQVRVAASRAAMAGADWIELRLDQWKLDEGGLGPLLSAVDLPVLLSCRLPEDGGSFHGTLDERRRLFEHGLDAGAAGVDLELWERWAPRTRELVVRSHHDLRGIPDDLPALRSQLLDAGDVAKIVGMAHDLGDVTPLFELLASGDPSREPTVAFALGERVSASRVLACALGSPYIYASGGTGIETAPGQLPVEIVAGLYRVRSLSTETSIGGVLGDPARHSLGPWLHNRALRMAGLDVVYLPFETSQPKAVLKALPWRRLVGLSVTAPHKETLARCCHELTDVAAAVGAVNTVVRGPHDVLVGHNTDVGGVRTALERAGLAGAAHPQETAVVLGGGGAARAAAIALRDMGFQVWMLTRSLERIRDFAKRHDFVVAAMRADILRDAAPRAVVHATPVGSAGGPPGRVLEDWTPERDSFVLDMVYRPHVTPLLAAAAAVGAVAVPGIEMFLAQAAEQVEAFGAAERPDVETLRDLLAGFVSSPRAS